MPIARNQKEFEKMIMGKIKKDLPKLTREYCHKWYGSHSEMKDIISEERFIRMVNNSFKLSIHNNEFKVEFSLSKNEISKEHSERMDVLWEEFESGYKKYIMEKFTK